MKYVDFPLTNTKSKKAGTKSFDLGDPADRKAYFEAKVGAEIDQIEQYLKSKNFVCFLLGKKNSGKGTYSKLFMEAVGANHIAHISVGDIVRSVHEDLASPEKKAELYQFLDTHYRSTVSKEEALDALLGRSTTALLPTEIIIALVEREVSKTHGKAIFIDGFPRNLEQIGYSMYLRSIVGYHDSPDMFVFIDIPEAVIDERMQNRVVCPICKTPRSLKLLRTKEVGYDEATKAFYLMCDTPSCNKARMVQKEGDNLGIEAIRDRLEMDEKVMRTLIETNGIRKIFLRNAIPVDQATGNIDDYEITPFYEYEWLKDKKQVKISEEKWVVNDDEGQPSYSLLAPAVVVSFLRQFVKYL